MKEIAIVLVSGGLDSCVTAAIAHSIGYELAFLHLNYGQRTEKRELKAFNDIADFYGVEKRLIVNVEHLKLIGGSSLTDENIQLAEPDFKIKAITVDYVPFRNANILSIAVSWAEVINASKIFIGAHADDYAGFPDCREEFYKAFNEVIKLGTKAGVEGRAIEIVTPLINMNKIDIVKKGIELSAPLHLTWSCYEREDVACGVCVSCAYRLRAFQVLGINDPIPYAIVLDYSKDN